MYNSAVILNKKINRKVCLLCKIYILKFSFIEKTLYSEYFTRWSKHSTRNKINLHTGDIKRIWSVNMLTSNVEYSNATGKNSRSFDSQIGVAILDRITIWKDVFSDLCKRNIYVFLIKYSLHNENDMRRYNVVSGSQYIDLSYYNTLTNFSL